QEVAVTVAGEGEPRIGGQHSRAGFRPEFMAPTNLASLVIDRFDNTFPPNAIVRTCPSVDSIGWLGKIDAVAGVCVDNEQPILGVEARRTEVGHAPLVRRQMASTGRRFLGRIGSG